MPHRYKTVLLFGAPGSGKGTQGKVLGNIPGFFHQSCGDVFRNIDIHSDIGRTFYEYSSKGELVPDDVTVSIWKESLDSRIATHEYKPKCDLLILDGIPRTVDQARLIDDHVDVLHVIHLVCLDEEAMFQRLRRRALKQNRHDDADEKVIRNRWSVYEQETYPILDHYSKDKITEIDAVQSPVQVLMQVLKTITPIQDRHFIKFQG